MNAINIPDYKKDLILRKDTSNIGLGAVLYQKDINGKEMPIKWASKKLTETEKRYGISEKNVGCSLWNKEIRIRAKR